jgi:23S rRNA pseudouridine2605 synthase
MGRHPLAKPKSAANTYRLGKVPLERALSKLGLASRSQTRQMVLLGKLKVNGKVITDPDFLVTPETDRLEAEGKVFQTQTQQVILLNKPKGYVTTARDEKGRKTIYDLLPSDLHHLHPVGRLDMHTTGLLLLTNDTKLSSYLTDPANALERVYVVTVEGRITGEHIKELERGVRDGTDILKARGIISRKISNRESHLMVTLTEGKNREIRRMFAAIGHEVTALKRIAFGPVKLGGLPLGKYTTIAHVI